MQKRKHYFITMFNRRLRWGGIVRTDNIDYLEKGLILLKSTCFLPFLCKRPRISNGWFYFESTPKTFILKRESYRGVMTSFFRVYKRQQCISICVFLIHKLYIKRIKFLTHSKRKGAIRMRSPCVRRVWTA
jgi:hypothetical protein